MKETAKSLVSTLSLEEFLINTFRELLNTSVSQDEDSLDDIQAKIFLELRRLNPQPDELHQALDRCNAIAQESGYQHVANLFAELVKGRTVSTEMLQRIVPQSRYTLIPSLWRLTEGELGLAFSQLREFVVSSIATGSGEELREISKLPNIDSLISKAITIIERTNSLSRQNIALQFSNDFIVRFRHPLTETLLSILGKALKQYITGPINAYIFGCIIYRQVFPSPSPCLLSEIDVSSNFIASFHDERYSRPENMALNQIYGFLLLITSTHSTHPTNCLASTINVDAIRPAVVYILNNLEPDEFSRFYNSAIQRFTQLLLQYRSQPDNLPQILFAIIDPIIDKVLQLKMIRFENELILTLLRVVTLMKGVLDSRAPQENFITLLRMLSLLDSNTVLNCCAALEKMGYNSIVGLSPNPSELFKITDLIKLMANEAPLAPEERRSVISRIDRIQERYRSVFERFSIIDLNVQEMERKITQDLRRIGNPLSPHARASSKKQHPKHKAISGREAAISAAAARAGAEPKPTQAMVKASVSKKSTHAIPENPPFHFHEQYIPTAEERQAADAARIIRHLEAEERRAQAASQRPAAAAAAAAGEEVQSTEDTPHFYNSTTKQLILLLSVVGYPALVYIDQGLTSNQEAKRFIKKIIEEGVINSGYIKQLEGMRGVYELRTTGDTRIIGYRFNITMDQNQRMLGCMASTSFYIFPDEASHSILSNPSVLANVKRSAQRIMDVILEGPTFAERLTTTSSLELFR
jgi:hypothetical protein